MKLCPVFARRSRGAKCVGNYTEVLLLLFFFWLPCIVVVHSMEDLYTGLENLVERKKSRNKQEKNLQFFFPS